MWCPGDKQGPACLERAIPFSDLDIDQAPFAAGGAGQVYKGRLSTKGKEIIGIAAKRTFLSMMFDSIKEFEEELTLLATLAHPNVVRLFGTSRDPATGAFYMVMEFCEGGTIKDLCEPANASYSPALMARACTQLFDGVAYIHRCGIFHTDLKPQNVLLSRDGVVKICDMGQATRLSISVAHEPAEANGTVHYMPPEVQPGSLKTDSRNLGAWDVYSLAVLTTELWVRRHPWSEVDNADVTRMVLGGSRPDFPAALATELLTKGDTSEDTATAKKVSSVAAWISPTPPKDLRMLVYSMWMAEPAARPDMPEVCARFDSISRMMESEGSSPSTWHGFDWPSAKAAVYAAQEVPAAFTEHAGGRAMNDRGSSAAESSGSPIMGDWMGPFGNAKVIDFCDGWNLKAGSKDTIDHALLQLLGSSAASALDLAGSGEERTRWFLGGGATPSPWGVVRLPRKWKVRSLNGLPGDKGGLARAMALSTLSKSTATTMLFDVEYFLDEVRLPLNSGVRRTKWLIVGYLSPLTRLVKCVSGFVSKEEMWFPFALQTLRAFTASPDRKTPTSILHTFPIRKGSIEGLLSVSESCDHLKPGSGVTTAELTFDLISPLRGCLRVEAHDVPFRLLKEIGPGFYNVRVPFTILGGLVDVGNHMSFIRLEGSCKFLAIDAVDPCGDAIGQSRKGELKEEIDRLTRGGRLIEAVVATHPFHTMGFKPFFEAYHRVKTWESAGSGGTAAVDYSLPPRKLLWYGTPRHLRRFPDIPWDGDVSDPRVQQKWVLQGVELRLPPGCEFNDPTPRHTNHFANLFVYSRASKAVHNDDCLCYFDHPSRNMGLLSGAFGVRHDQLAFHSSFKGPGLTEPKRFQSWLDSLVSEWEFEHLCTAHNGVLCGNANVRVRRLLHDSAETFDELESRRGEAATVSGKESATVMQDPPSDAVDDVVTESDDPGCECG